MAEKQEPQKKAHAKPEEQKERQASGMALKEKVSPKKIVRLVEKDVDGNLPLYRVLSEIRGVGFMYANAISKICGFGRKKVGDLTQQEKEQIEEMVSNPEKHGIPRWMYNRRFDPEDGSDRHLVASRLELKKKMDINELKKRKCYRGVRHILGLPVRGQRTRSSFRTSTTVGVSRAKAKPGAAKK